MVLLGSLTGYVIVSVILFLAMRAKCKKSAVLRAPKRKWVFYLLSFTWGLPMVTVGAAAALVLRLKGYKPKKYGWAWCFELPDIRWGISLGLFIITPPGHENVHMHEHGHCIQNIYFGFFMPLVVSLPSVMRFWYRKAKEKRGQKCRVDYDGVWFERSASESGKTFFCKLSDSKTGKM